MAERFPTEQNYDVSSRSIETRADGKIVYGTAENIGKLFNTFIDRKENYTKRTGIILDQYSGDLKISDDGKYEKDHQYKQENSCFVGAFGQVNVCIDIKNNRPFALKQYQKSRVLCNNKACKSVYREVNALLQCNHKNIIKLFGLIIDASTICLLMEYGGTSIKDRVKKKAKFWELKPPRGKLMLIEQFFQAIEYLHGIGFVHCDLHFGNILISNIDNCLKLCDLGSAKYLNSRNGKPDTLFTASHGYTYWNFPPTVLNLYFEKKSVKHKSGQPSYDDEILKCFYVSIRLDLYAAGKLILELEKGMVHKPFQGQDLTEPLKSRDEWVRFVDSNIPKNCKEMTIGKLIKGLMTYTTTDSCFQTTTDVIEYIRKEMKDKCSKSSTVLPVPPLYALPDLSNTLPPRSPNHEPMEVD